jgi:hypothetical protein
LLEFAEAQGLTPDSSCRGGSCGSCRTRIVEGSVAYANQPSAQISADEALICCATPACDPNGKDVPLVLDL